MKTTLRLLFIINIFFFSSLYIYSYETDSMMLHLKIGDICEAAPPYVLESNIIFSFKADYPIRFVGASFAHEDFSKSRRFIRNQHGVFILIYPLPWNEKTLYYRIVVDGLWMPDPTNKQKIKDSSGIYLSKYRIPEIKDINIISPIIDKNKSVEFIYTGSANLKPFLAGDFNCWDPFMYPLKEISSGKYSITLRIPKGEHYYAYFLNGSPILDPNNPARGEDSEGNEVSTFFIP